LHEVVPYKGTGPALSDTIRGQTNALLGSVSTTLPHVRSGRLRALAVTTPNRLVAEPQIPTVAESGVPGYQTILWHGLIGPKGLPAPIVERLYTEIARILKTPDIQKRLSDLGLNVSEMTPAQLTALIKTDVPRLGKIVKETGARAD